MSGKFGRLHGVDIDEHAINTALETNPWAHYQVYDGNSLPFADDTFDFVFAANVRHHVPPSGWEHFITQMTRVARKGGLVTIFEHNPLNPLTRLVVSRCSFDKDAVLLRQTKVTQLQVNDSLKPVEKKFILFFPFRSRIAGSVENKLRWLPLGAQYYVVGQKV